MSRLAVDAVESIESRCISAFAVETFFADLISAPPAFSPLIDVATEDKEHSAGASKCAEDLFARIPNPMPAKGLQPLGLYPKSCSFLVPLAFSSSAPWSPLDDAG